MYARLLLLLLSSRGEWEGKRTGVVGREEGGEGCWRWWSAQKPQNTAVHCLRLLPYPPPPPLEKRVCVSAPSSSPHLHSSLSPLRKQPKTHICVTPPPSLVDFLTFALFPCRALTVPPVTLRFGIWYGFVLHSATSEAGWGGGEGRGARCLCRVRTHGVAFLLFSHLPTSSRHRYPYVHMSSCLPL